MKKNIGKPDFDLDQSCSFEELKDECLGVPGTTERDLYEFELQIDLLGETLKRIRKERNLTQEELAKRIGIDNTQISKLEKNSRNATIATIIKVFAALNARVNLQIELDPLD